MPLFILVIAAALAWWGTQRNTAQNEAVQRYVLQICGSIASGQDLSGRVNPANTFAEKQLIEQIKRVCDSPQALLNLKIVVTPGDAPFVRDRNSQATHTAMLTLNGVDELGLRVLYVDQNNIRILGFWLPRESQAP